MDIRNNTSSYDFLKSFQNCSRSSYSTAATFMKHCGVLVKARGWGVADSIPLRTEPWAIINVSSSKAINPRLYEVHDAVRWWRHGNKFKQANF